MVRYPLDHKAESRARAVAAAGRGFRRLGFGGVGVDGLAREAGVTHGGFYSHFRSKTEAFRAAVIAGLDELRGGIEALRMQEGPRWLASFADFYMGYKRTCELGEACTLPSLSPDIERAAPEVRDAYVSELRRVAEALADGLAGDDHAERMNRAWAMLALLSGGVTLARAVPDPELSERIAHSVRAAVLAIGDPTASAPSGDDTIA